MRNGDDLHAARRMELLRPVARMCAEAGVAVEPGAFRNRAGAAVRALLAAAVDGSWDARITAVRASRVPREGAWDGHDLVRNPRDGYDLNAAGEIAYQIEITEENDGDEGRARRPVVVSRLFGTTRAAADEMILWARRDALFRTVPPTADPRRLARRDRRRFEHREARAAAPRVRVDAVPDEAAEDLAALDPTALSWHFPRDHTGRYRRSATVLLASYGGRGTHLRDRWLTVRVDGDGLLLTTADLIGAHQRHRWDGTPWLWDTRHAGTPTPARWQVAHPGQAAPVMAAMWRGALAEALATAGVRVDEHIARLLTGAPNRSFRCALTATWVSGLYAGLADLAPWRLAAAYEGWRTGRTARGLRPGGPVVLFGLGGMTQQRKPKLALGTDAGVPLLRLVFTASNTVLPRSLWTVPADLGAYLRGWCPSISPAAGGAFHGVRTLGGR